MLALLRQAWVLPCIDRDDPLEGDADAGKLGGHVGKPVWRAIEIDNQAFHFRTKVFTRGYTEAANTGVGMLAVAIWIGFAAIGLKN